MPYFYVKTNTSFLWPPYAHLAISEDKKTLTIYVNDFYSQSLAGKPDSGPISTLSYYYHYTVGHSARLGNDITSWISNEERLNQFSEKDILRALVCLTQSPVDVPSEMHNYWDPNPWPVIDPLIKDHKPLITQLKQQYPELECIHASAEPGLSLFSFFEEQSALLQHLKEHGITVTNQIHLQYSEEKTTIFKPG